MFQLENSVALVLGAAAGMGRATAQFFREAGATVAVADMVRSVADDTAGGLGSAVTAHQVDATDPESMSALFDEVLAAHGRIDSIVNVIGGSRLMPVHETSLRDLDGMMRLNLVPHWVAVSEFVRRCEGGSYVGLSSGSGTVSSPTAAAYGAAKAAFDSLVRSAAEAYAPRGFRINGVAPGMTETPRIAAAITSGPDRDKHLATIPLGRFGQPSDIAAAAVFLSSPLASYITGQVLTVDGGKTGASAFGRA